MFANNPGEARKYFGGGGDDWKMIGEKVVETKEGVTRVEGIQPYMKGYWDSAATLKPLTPGEAIARVGEYIFSPHQGKWALIETVDAIRAVLEFVKKSIPV